MNKKQACDQSWRQPNVVRRVGTLVSPPFCFPVRFFPDSSQILPRVLRFLTALRRFKDDLKGSGRVSEEFGKSLGRIWEDFLIKVADPCYTVGLRHEQWSTTSFQWEGPSPWGCGIAREVSDRRVLTPPGLDPAVGPEPGPGTWVPTRAGTARAVLTPGVARHERGGDPPPFGQP